MRPKAKLTAFLFWQQIDHGYKIITLQYSNLEEKGI